MKKRSSDYWAKIERGPRISAVIPVYNGEHFIAKTVESVLGQSYPAHEIIVIDDGSTDGTSKILEGFGDKIISRRIANSGGAPGRPRNVGMKMTTGDFVALLDADDLWFKDKLKRHAEFILKYPNAGFFCCDYFFRIRSRKFRLKKHYTLIDHPERINFDAPLKADPFRLLIRENFVGSPSAVVIKKEVIDKIGGFREEPRYKEDHGYWFRCANVTDFVVMSDVLVFKKAHPASRSSDLIWSRERHGNTLRKTMEDMGPYIAKKRLRGELEMALARNYYDLGNNCFEAGKVGRAFREYLHGLASSRAPKNLVSFAGTVSRKVLRLLSFNIISRERLDRS
jgi:glycosyltransferase involved in cell wall biosynthesis